MIASALIPFGLSRSLEILAKRGRPCLPEQGAQLRVGTPVGSEGIPVGLPQRADQRIAVLAVDLTAHVAMPAVETRLRALAHRCPFRGLKWRYLPYMSAAPRVKGESDTQGKTCHHGPGVA